MPGHPIGAERRPVPRPQREDTWAELRERIADIDLFIAPTRYYADTMAQRAGIPADKLEHTAG